MPESGVILSLFIAFAAAKISGEIMARLKQPAVLGELLAGIIIGPYALRLIQPSSALSVVAQLGVIVLLFLVGLETRVSDLKKVGGTALLVAAMGVLFPFVLGFLAFLYLRYTYPEALFVGTALVATSVGITARVLSDLGLLDKIASRIVLAAAVIDDVIGLMILTVVKGLTNGGISLINLGLLMSGMTLFLILFLALGGYFAKKHSQFMKMLHIREAAFVFPVILTLGLAALAEKIGLAAIIGAFLAGVLLAESEHSQRLVTKTKPISHLLTPFFFVLMGTYVNVKVFLNPKALAIISLLFFLAVIGKVAGGAIGSIKQGRKVMLQTGVGMIPRGEVGLIVGIIGLTMHIISPSVYTMVVSVSLLTTLVTPPLIRWAFKSEMNTPIVSPAAQKAHRLQA